MPKVAIYKFLTFYLYSFDVLNEPPHLHVKNSKSSYAKSAKIWLESLEFSETGNLTQKELNLVEKLVRQNQRELMEAFFRLNESRNVRVINLDK